jgi:hypothetical protein
VRLLECDFDKHVEPIYTKYSFTSAVIQLIYLFVVFFVTTARAGDHHGISSSRESQSMAQTRRPDHVAVWSPFEAEPAPSARPSSHNTESSDRPRHRLTPRVETPRAATRASSEHPRAPSFTDRIVDRRPRFWENVARWAPILPMGIWRCASGRTTPTPSTSRCTW